MSTEANMFKLSIAIFSACVLVACVDVGPSVDTPEASAEDRAMLSTASLIGTWQFEIGDERRAKFYAELEAKFRDPAKLAAAKAELEHEVSTSELQFDGAIFSSRVEGKEILRSSYVAKPLSSNSLLLSTKGGEAKSTTVRFVDGDTIVIDDPKKGPLTFRRSHTDG
jgi:hypothetical protein